jgi:MFS transporter, SP family, sugar:H+ symporter
MGSASVPYLLGGEIPNSALREKTQSLGAAWNVVWAFVTNFVMPYMINSIHFQVGWVFGSMAFLAALFTFFFLPETNVSITMADSLQQRNELIVL